MLAFVPLAFLVHQAHLPPLLQFLVAGFAIAPLAGLIASSTEDLAEHLGPHLGSFLNATFGNATELIIASVALKSGLAEVVRGSLAGAALVNLLMGLGLAMFLGGLRFKEQTFRPEPARINNSLLVVTAIALATPAVLHAATHRELPDQLDTFSRVASALLLGVYGLMILFSMRTHRHLFMAGEVEGSDRMSPAQVHRPLQKTVAALFAATFGMVLVSEILVDSLERTIEVLHLSPLFTGVVLLPLFGSIVEYVTCINAAWQNKMDLAIAIAIGSTLQIFLFVAPALVLAGAWLGQPLTLDFELYTIAAVAGAIFIVSSISSDGKCNWLEGTLLIATYALLAVGFFVHP
jgi:Ca2+:H+ antiporter